jgi:hypothetical protein
VAGAPVLPDFFANIAAKHLRDDTAPDGLGDLDDLATYKQAKAETELELHAAQAVAKAAQAAAKAAAAELAILEQRLKAEAQKR